MISTNHLNLREWNIIVCESFGSKLHHIQKTIDFTTHVKHRFQGLHAVTHILFHMLPDTVYEWFIQDFMILLVCFDLADNMNVCFSDIS